MKASERKSSKTTIDKEEEDNNNSLPPPPQLPPPPTPNLSSNIMKQYDKYSKTQKKTIKTNETK